MTPAEDAAYMDAVRRGDMETAARMVREAAAKAMPDTKVVGEDGLPLVVWHGASKKFTVFDTYNSHLGPDRLPQHSLNPLSTYGWFTDKKSYAQVFATANLVSSFVDIKTPFYIERSDVDAESLEKAKNHLESLKEQRRKIGLSNAERSKIGKRIIVANETVRRIESEGTTYGKLKSEAEKATALRRSRGLSDWKSEGANLRETLREEGFDGVIIIDTEIDGDLGGKGAKNFYIPFGDHPSQIKSADPVTYDDAGNVIPLSQRFNPQNNDIRYSVYGVQGAGRAGIGNADEAERMERGGATREDIWRTTGWWRGHDGKWRIDVDDEAFADEIAAALEYEWSDEEGKTEKPSIKDMIGSEDLKSESLDRLVKAYPKLADTTLSIMPDQFSLSGKGPKADYNPETNEIRVFENAAFRDGKYDARSVAFEIVHEIQHAIQTMEGHPNGRKVSHGGIMFVESARDRRRNLRDTIADYGEMEAYIAQRRHVAGRYERQTVPPWEMERMYLRSANRQFGFRLGPKDIRFSVNSSINALSDIANGKAYGVLHNEEYGEIRYPLGHMGKGGFGFLHIIEQRMAKDGATLDEAIDTAIRVGVSAQIGTETASPYNTHHLDYRGTRAIIGEMPDKTIVITGYEIDADDVAAANRRAAALAPRPHVRSEEVIRALKEKLASTPDILPYSGAEIKPEDKRHSVVSLGQYRTGDLRELAHGVKDGDEAAIEEAGRRLAGEIPPGAVLVPMPSRTGKPTTMLRLARAIASSSEDALVVDALRSDPHESNYAQKKRGHAPARIEMGQIVIKQVRPVLSQFQGHNRELRDKNMIKQVRPVLSCFSLGS